MSYGQLVRWTWMRLPQIEQARERVLARINATPKAGRLPQGNNSFANPYRPNFPDKGQNTTAPGEEQLRHVLSARS